MNRYPAKLVLCLSMFLLLAPILRADPPGAGLAGDWSGALDVGSAKLRLALHVEAKSDGSLTAVLDSIDQGGAKIPVDSVAVEHSTLRLTFKEIAASYEGTVSSDGKTVEGTWSQSGQQLPLTFHRQEKAAEPK
ncbi:MAG TPA: hypothetical protein VLX28_01975 [Thermoanaerobaculia bacterium]|nr:hypothetical protein [Thermoanaerobaculia bacterium]